MPPATAIKQKDQHMPASTSAASTLLLGLIGQSIQGSRSPQLHEEEARQHGMRCLYQLHDLPLDSSAEQLSTLLAAMQTVGYAGCNITHPFKQTVLACLDSLSDDATAIGAVNTVQFRDGKCVGHNTDWWGFAQSFQQQWPQARLTRVVQLGAGGAGAAVAHAILTLGCQHLTLHDADPARASALAARLNQRFGEERVVVADDVAAALAAADGLIQATPIGMQGHPGLPLPAKWLHPALWVADVIYFPRETALLKAANALGCATMNGGGMVVYQAAGAFRLFSGLTPDAARMSRHFSRLSD
jgi:shikimate dehydrogenase